MPLHTDQQTSASYFSTVGLRSLVLPSAADLIFLAILFSLTCSALASRLLGDAGIGWHIRNGELMLQSHAVTRTDPFSATMSGQPWYAWEWLYDLLAAAMHHWMGLNGVVFLAALVIAAAFALTLRIAVGRGGTLPVTILMLALALGASAIHLFARPHVSSWLFTVLWFQRLDDWEANPSSNRVFWLPPLMLLWVNLHGGFVTGFMLLAIYWASGFWQFLSPGLQANSKPPLKKLAIVTVLSLLATLANPYGYKLHEHIYQYVNNAFLMDHIQEFRSPDFHGVAQQCFLLLVVLAIVALAISKQKPRVSQVLLILFAAASGFYSARNLPVSSLLLTLTVAPLLSRAIAAAKDNSEMAGPLRHLLSRGDQFAARMGSMELSLRGHLWPLAGVIFGLWICLHGGNVGSSQWMDAQFPAKRFPVHAVDLLAQGGFSEPVFCPDSWGGYLIYRLYPGTKVVADDRHDLYGEQFFRQYLQLIQAEPGWNEFLNQRKVNVALLPSGSALANLLKESPQWKLVYEDKVGVLFQRRGV